MSFTGYCHICKVRIGPLDDFCSDQCELEAERRSECAHEAEAQGYEPPKPWDAAVDYYDMEDFRP